MKDKLSTSYKTGYTHFGVSFFSFVHMNPIKYH